MFQNVPRFVIFYRRMYTCSGVQEPHLHNLAIHLNHSAIVRAKTGMNTAKTQAAIESFWRRLFVINDVFVVGEFLYRQVPLPCNRS